MAEKPAQQALPAASDARIVRTRAALRDALLALIARKPLGEITVRDIAAEAGTGYATFFRHYPSKTALLDEIAAQEIKEVIARSMPLLSESDAKPAALELCRYIDAHRALWTALLTGGAAGIVREEFIRQTTAIAAAQPTPRTTLPGDLAVVFGVVGSVEILAWWLEKGKDVPVEELADILGRLVIAPAFGGK